MAHRIGDRILETTTVTGTGNATFLGAQVGYSSVDSFCTTNGDTIDLVIGWATNAGVMEYEYNRFTRVSAGVYSRAATPWSSSNGGAATSFTAGTKEVWSDIGAFFAEHLNTVPITVASAATMDIGAVRGIRIDSSGTTGPVTSFGTAKSKLRIVKWSGQIITAGANLVLLGVPSGFSRTTASGDISILSSDNQSTPVWTEISFQRVSSPAAPFDALAYNGMQINGSMDVSQENVAASVAVGTGSVTKYLLDGVYCTKSGTSVLAFQQVASVFPGYNNALKMTVTTAQASIGANVVALVVPIEGWRFKRAMWGTASAQPISICLWMKSSLAGTPVLRLSDGISVVVSAVSLQTLVSNTAKFCTYTFPAQTTWGGSSTTGVGVQAELYLADTSFNGVSSTSNTFELTGLVVLPGIELPSSERASFIMRPFDQELLICKRYYEKSYPLASAPGTSSVGGSTDKIVPSNTIANLQDYGSERFMVSKRTVPTITMYGYSGTAGVISNQAGTDLAAGSGLAVGPSENAFTGRNNSGGSLTTTANVVLYQWAADARI